MRETILEVPLRLPDRIRKLLPFIAAAAILCAFIALNHSAYDGFFQDDELDNLKWAPSRPAMVFFTRLLSPQFDVENFRPVGYLYFALMGSKFGLDFPPYMTPIFAMHLLNAVLLFLLIRKLGIKMWCAIAAAAFFTLSATALDAYWKPMYVFDLLCTTFSLLSILFYASRRWILSFVAFWLAYKAKELAVLLPVVLLAYEYWFGERKFKVLIPFLLASLSFGIQGIFLNPNKDNEYTFRFNLPALLVTAPFYAQRILLFPLSAFLLLGLALLRDRRIWFSLAAMVLLMVPLLFLPGRLYEAYAYLPLACACIAMAAAASHWSPLWAWVALALWMPWNVRQIRHERREILQRDDLAYSFVDKLGKFAVANPDVDTLVYDGVPPGLHFWGVTGAWNMIHHRLDMPALYIKWPETRAVLASKVVAFGYWDPLSNSLEVRAAFPAR